MGLGYFMNVKEELSRSLCSEAPDKPVFVVVAYEDETARRQAMEICSQETENLGCELEFEISWWDFDQLRDTRLKHEATTVTLKARLVIVASRSGEELPAQVKHWLLDWMRSKGDKGINLAAAIGLREEEEVRQSAAHRYLQKVAGQFGVPYCESCYCVEAAPSRFSLDAILSRSSQETSTLEKILHNPVKLPNNGLRSG